MAIIYCRTRVQETRAQRGFRPFNEGCSWNVDLFFFEPRSIEAQSSRLKAPQWNTLHCPSEFNGAKQRKACISGGLNAGHNHSSPNGEGVWGTLYTLWLGGWFYVEAGS